MGILFGVLILFSAFVAAAVSFASTFVDDINYKFWFDWKKNPNQ